MERIETTTTTKTSPTNNNNINNNDDNVDILFLHGLLGQGRNLKTFAKQVCHLRQAQHGWLMDLRGHGHSRIIAVPQTTTMTTTTTTTRNRTTFANCVADIEYTINHHCSSSNNNNHHDRSRTLPRTVVGHSWGGRMAVQYAHQSLLDAATSTGGSSTPPIKEVWLLDVVPGKANGSVEKVVEIVARLQQQQGYANNGMPMTTKKELVRRLMEEEGLDLPTSSWLASSFSHDDTRGTSDFGFDLSVVQDILPEFETQDLEGMMMDLLQAGVHVHVVRAGKNRAWDENPTVWNRWKQLQQQQQPPFHGLLGLHVLPNAGHWVHVDDLKGLVALFATNQQ
jgi:pimeloyl-ACP methyl ester carboxylesterase